ncbi:glutamine--tRNA ligase/YqeY domain fusion protein [Nitrosomonas sp. Nm166]|uniref:glutamine--tRNA ligase/YqeY domain fusion protein n=1 Tax=Nitrosomonas sp. Nm166 TaxID=1881054 RepID=UPI0008ECCE97|nr:glutamine--tRNA ligase/YqeY domain fusion protein [Nitrosomonas sp. Nm166]SFE46021.1 glutaminyl-tRNA synthetase [Nitrosomonas sp. Nm166]
MKEKSETNLSLESTPTNFIRHIIDEDNRNGKWNGRVETRFPPEPNGYLHIGHAKSICLNFGIALNYGGVCHLRFDDTNPEKEAQEYVDSICASVSWLGFDWGDHLYYASDYFDQLYEFAEYLIKQGKAYIESLSADEIREFRGTLTSPGKNSPYRDRPIEENLDLFRRMKAGEFPDGQYVLRAKIDMASPNINMRDPVIYRIRHVHHQRTGDKWCIYPMYDYTHCISDALERITHSLCTLEFEDHRPLYDWVLDQLVDKVPCHPQQIEFARLNLTYTIMSKRKLIELVENKLVDGWDDPRLSTLAGVRRRGFTPRSLRLFADRIGISKADSWIDMSILEDCLREDLNESAPRRVAILKPLKLIIDNYPENQQEDCFAPNHPQKPEWGKRTIPFSKTLYIERDDFMEVPAKGYFRLSPGAEVRLRYAFIVKCVQVDKNAQGEIEAVHCTYDPDTKSGTPGAESRKVKGNIHWLSAQHAQAAEVRLYDRLFIDPYPDSGDKNYKALLNPDSKQIITAYAEPALCDAQPEQRFQFERNGYFVADRVDMKPSKPVFNRAVTLRDSWGKVAGA